MTTFIILMIFAAMISAWHFPWSVLVRLEREKCVDSSVTNYSTTWFYLVHLLT
jgi:hypothetical protein